MGLSFERLKNMFETVAELDIDFMGVKINLLEEKKQAWDLNSSHRGQEERFQPSHHKNNNNNKPKLKIQ